MKNDLIMVDELLANLHIAMIGHDKDLASITNLQLIVSSLKFWLIRAMKKGLTDIGYHVCARIADFYGDKFQNDECVQEKIREFQANFILKKSDES